MEKLSTNQIAELVGCSRTTVWRALTKANIKKYHHGTKHMVLDDYDWLYQKYWIEKLTPSEIAKIVGCHKDAVWGKMKTLNVPRRSLSESKKGTKHSKDARAKMSKAKKNMSLETKQKIRDARKRQRIPTTRTVIECIYWKISKKNNIPSEYTGDGKIWIGNLNPDFIIRDKRVAIFINGDYWHSPLLNHKLNPKRTVTHQIVVCKRHRWKPVTIWGTDLEREDAEEFVLSQLKKAGVI